EQEEAHDLEDPLALPLVPRRRVDVADVAELLDEPALDPGLLMHLPHRCLRRRLAGVDVALRQCPDARLAARTDRRDHLAAADRPPEHPACRELSLHLPLLLRPPAAPPVDVSAWIVAEIGRADHEQLEAVRPGLVASPRTGRDANRIPLPQLDDLVV